MFVSKGDCNLIHIFVRIKIMYTVRWMVPVTGRKSHYNISNETSTITQQHNSACTLMWQLESTTYAYAGQCHI
jgi:hypothetical protein